MTALRERRVSERIAAIELELPRTVEAPSIARTAMAGLCREIGLNGSCHQTLLLLVSEVVSNAVLHSGGPDDERIGFSASASEEAVTVSVTDAGEGFTPGEPGRGRPDGGFGLQILERAASRWGVDCEGQTRVWFELSR
jgi:anti-sigma regulatory factor (Ser/Thr protein kinase)